MQDGTQVPLLASGGVPGGIARLRLPDGELWVSLTGGREAAVEAYVRAGAPYREDFRPEMLCENARKGISVTKLAVPGVGTCVLKEMSTATMCGWRRRLEMAFRIAWRRKFRRTFA